MRGTSRTLLFCLAISVVSFTSLTGQEKDDWRTVFELSMQEIESRLVVTLKTSVPVPPYECRLDAARGSREISLRMPGARSYLEPSYAVSTPHLARITIEDKVDQMAGTVVRFVLRDGSLAAIEQFDEGLRVEFALGRALGSVPGEGGSHLYRVGVGDKIGISVFGHEDLIRTLEVRPDGAVEFPLIGAVKVAGKTTGEIASDISRALSQDYLVSPQVDVDVRDYRSQWVTVLGEVRAPARYILNGDMRLIDLIAQAGGLTKEAGAEISITRHGDENRAEQIDVDRDQLMDERNSDANIPLQHGDIVTVSEKRIFYIRGQVNRPGSYFLEKDMTVLRAIAVAGGFSQFANRKQVELLRVGNSGVNERIDVNLRAIEKGKQQDLALMPNDTIIVPRRIF